MPHFSKPRHGKLNPCLHPSFRLTPLALHCCIAAHSGFYSEISMRLWPSLFLTIFIGSAASAQAPKIERIDPPNWWIGLPSPMLLVRGEQLTLSPPKAQPSVAPKSQGTATGHFSGWTQNPPRRKPSPSLPPAPAVKPTAPTFSPAAPKARKLTAASLLPTCFTSS